MIKKATIWITGLASLIAAIVLLIVNFNQLLSTLGFSDSENETETEIIKPTEESMYACIDDKISLAEKQVRTETITLSLAAGLGKLIRCKTKKTIKEKFGQGVMENEYIDGSPVCALVSAEVEDRAKIMECVIKNNKPYIKVEVKGKGCEYSNKASFSITTRYKKNIDGASRESFKKDCEHS
jgi:hypothetical protein